MLISDSVPNRRRLLIGINFPNLDKEIMTPNTEILEITAIGKTLNLNKRPNEPIQPNLGSQFPNIKVLKEIIKAAGKIAPIKNMAIF